MGLFDLPHFSKLIQEALKKSPDQAGLQAEAPRLAKASAVLAKIRLSFVGYAGKLAACDMETLFHQAQHFKRVSESSRDLEMPASIRIQLQQAGSTELCSKVWKGWKSQSEELPA